jgi:hypothetical protein
MDEIENAMSSQGDYNNPQRRSEPNDGWHKERSARQRLENERIR